MNRILNKIRAGRDISQLIQLGYIHIQPKLSHIPTLRCLPAPGPTAAIAGNPFSGSVLAPDVATRPRQVLLRALSLVAGLAGTGTGPAATGPAPASARHQAAELRTQPSRAELGTQPHSQVKPSRTELSQATAAQRRREGRPVCDTVPQRLVRDTAQCRVAENRIRQCLM